MGQQPSMNYFLQEFNHNWATRRSSESATGGVMGAPIPPFPPTAALVETDPYHENMS